MHTAHGPFTRFLKSAADTSATGYFEGLKPRVRFLVFISEVYAFGGYPTRDWFIAGHE